MTDTPRVLLVHAHPDDETITTGGTIAALVSEGAEVMVLTATRGEGGESSPPTSNSSKVIAGLARVGSRRSPRRCVLWACACTPSSAGPPAPSRFGNGMGTRRAPGPPSMTDNACAQLMSPLLPGTSRRHRCPRTARGHHLPPTRIRAPRSCASARSHDDGLRPAEWRTGRLLYVDTPTEVARRSFDPNQDGFALTASPPPDDPGQTPGQQIVIDQDVTSVCRRNGRPSRPTAPR